MLLKQDEFFTRLMGSRNPEKMVLFILEGDKSMVEKSIMSRKAVQGALIHLTVFLGLPVIRSISIKETASLLSDICSQCREQTLPRQKPVIYRNPGIRITKKQRQKLFLLQNLPGIGTKKRLALLKAFSTIENILNASSDDLTKVRGIGNRLANRIFTILHEPF
jgi:ERCC4-type nuclease